jgi:hypothetical protein
MAKDSDPEIVAARAKTANEPRVVCVTVQPGICGFTCTVRAQRMDRRAVAVTISGSQCKQIQRLSDCVTTLSLKDLFTPLTRNPVYTSAEKSGCHASCAVPAAVIKAAEVALEMALPRDVRFHITCVKGESD